MTLMNLKNVYFVPYGQDDYKSKPCSLVAHFDMVIPTIEEAVERKANTAYFEGICSKVGLLLQKHVSILTCF